MSEIKYIDVAIIGGGWSGILACKYMVQNNLNTLAFEASDDIGGVFKYREDVKDVGGVMKSTHLTSSKTLTEMSDYPMPNEYSHFPSHQQVLKYLNDYIDHFQIRQHFMLNTKIVSVEKKQNNWVLEDSKGNFYQSKNLIVCSGVHQHPDMSCFTNEKFKNATVHKMHAAAYKRLIKDFDDERILIYGGGETASDISAELSHVANRIFLSIPHGQWLVNRYRRKFFHMDRPFINDNYSSELRALCDPAEEGSFAQYLIERDGGACGHGIKQWISPAGYLEQFLNKSAHIDHHIVLGSVVPKGEVDHVSGNEVVFSDGTKEKIDRIIFCTGYKTVFPFFKDQKYMSPINERFKFIFDNEDPTLAFVGFARPVIGSIPAISEMQSMYVGKIFSGKLRLPSKEARNQIIEANKKYQAKKFCHTSQRIAGLVNFGTYIEELGALLNMTPDLFKLFLQNPKKWVLAISAPYNSCRFHINDQSQHDRVFTTLRDRLHPLLIKGRYHFVWVIPMNQLPRFFTLSKKSVWIKKLNLYIVDPEELIFRIAA